MESLVKPREPFDEIILINDGSIDSSKSICEEYRMLYILYEIR